MTTRRKLVLLGSLYLAQGLPYGFFTQALPVLLRKQGMELPLIGLAQLLMLPWALKFAWAPVVDAVRAPRLGHRRAVIVPLQLASCAVLAALAFAATPGAMWPLAIAILLVNVCAATQDIATDGLAVEVLDADERGLGNGLQVGGYRVGMILGGGLILVVFDHAGWTVAFFSMSVMLLATTVPIFGYREQVGVERGAVATGREARGEAQGKAGRRRVVEVIRASLARPGMGRWLAVLATFKTGEWFATAMLRPYLSDAKQSMGDIGVMLGFAGFGAALIGALTGGAATRRLGRRRALLVFGGMQSLAITGLVLVVEFPSVPMFYALTVAEHFTSSMATAALFTAMMDFSRTEEAGTDYTVQASLVVIATNAAALLSGFSAEAIGYGAHFVAAGALSFVGVLVVFAYRPSHERFELIGPR